MRMTAVFLSRSHLMLPTVFGFKSAARDTTTEIFQASRFRRFCHTQSRSVAKLPAINERSDVSSSVGIKTDCAWEGTVLHTIKTRRGRHAGRRPNICSIVPVYSRACESLLLPGREKRVHKVRIRTVEPQSGRAIKRVCAAIR